MQTGAFAGGCSGLFYYVVLCSYANFRTSYRRIDGISYTVYPGEWICSITDITEWFRVRFHYQAFAILKSLQDRQLITFTRLGRGHIVKFSITDWRRNNTALDYNCPCQKDSGFFFIPVSTATELISAGRASEMDVILDLWISAIYKDQQVRGSEIGPVAYFRNGTGNPIVNYSELSARWGISRSSVGRLLKKLADFDYLSLLTFPGRSGTVIYLKNYLSTMFQISDVMICEDTCAGTDVITRGEAADLLYALLTGEFTVAAPPILKTITLNNKEGVHLNSYLLELQKIPEPIRQAFAERGWQYTIDYEYLARLSEERNMSCIGATNYGSRQITVSSAGATIHEFGHFLDELMGFPSQTEGFYQQESGTAAALLRPYALTNEREYFADCFVYWLTYRDNSKKMASLCSAAPKTYAYLLTLESQNWQPAA